MSINSPLVVFFTGDLDEKLNKFINKLFHSETMNLKQKKVINSIVHGVDFFINSNKIFYKFENILPMSEITKFNSDLKPQKSYYTSQEVEYPYLLVNLRGGVSFYKVISAQVFKRI